MHGRLKEDRFAIRTPLRSACAEGKLGQRARLSSADSDDVNLGNVVTLAFGIERDLGAVWTPGRVGLLAFCGRQAARGRAAIARDDPQIGGFVFFVVSGFGHWHDDPSGVRRGRGSADLFEEPKRFVRNGLFRLGGVGQAAGCQEGQEREEH